MRIAIFTYTMDRRAMGTALYTRQLVENLLKIKKPEDEIFLVHREKNSDPLYQCGREIIMPRVRLPRLSHFFSEALFLWRTRNDFDIIHYPQESIYPLFWLSRAKIVITMHSAVEGWQKYATLRRRWRQLYFMLKFLKRRIALLICSSRSTQQSILRTLNWSAEKLPVVYLGVGEIFKRPIDLEQASKVMSTKYRIPSPYILNGARIDPHKNVLRVAEAFAMARKKLGLKHKLVVGPKHWPAENKKVEKLIDELGLANEVIFMPYIEPEDMPALYAAADLFVFPSLHEGFGLPILEAMAVGTPVITSNIFSMPEVAGGAALLVDPASTDQISTAMCRLLDDEDLRRRLVQKGRQNVDRFNWAATATATDELYRRV